MRLSTNRTNAKRNIRRRILKFHFEKSFGNSSDSGFSLNKGWRDEFWASFKTLTASDSN